MKISFEINNDEIIGMIYAHVQEKLGPDANVKRDDIKIQVRSKQNYREKQFEHGELIVKYEGEI